MKRILPFLLLPVLSFAAEMSPDAAASAAKAWADRGYSMGKLPAGRAVSAVEPVEDPATGARLFVAKFQGGGYAVLSADDLVDPVLAFSESGDGIDLDERNPLWFLLRRDIAAREAAAGVVRVAAAPAAAGSGEGEGGAAAQPTASQRKWADLLSPAPKMAVGQGVASISDVRVDALVQSRWNQNRHNGYSNGLTCYDYYTPNNDPCGCGATAVSQVMRYFQFPTASVQARTYSCGVEGTPTDLTMQGGTYDWANMPLKPYEGSITEAQRRAIGKLTSDVGIAMDMMYTSDGSGSFLACGYQALLEDFGYANAAIENDGTSDMDAFKRCLIPSFDAKSPVVVSLSDHFIVADGYGYSGGDWYIHLNFGWGAAYNDVCDAWYAPPNFNVETSLGVDVYTYADQSLYNVFPDKTGSILSGRVADETGAPVSGATVSLDNGHSTTTDANGIYAFVEDVSTDTVFTVTAARGGSSASVQATLGKTRSVTWSPGEYNGITVRARTGSYTSGNPPVCGNSYGNDITLPEESGPALSPDDYDYRAKLTVAGYAGSSPLSGFPVLVRIKAGSPSGFAYDQLHQSSGADLAFADMDGNVLPFAIDTWNASGESLVWVQLPSMQNGTEFMMYWGSETTVAGGNPFAGYKGVWHMESASPADASGSGNDGTAGGSATIAAGQFGSALKLPDSSYVTCGTNQSNADLKNAFTVEAWANPDNYSGNHCIFGKDVFISLRTASQTKITATTPGKLDHDFSVSSLPDTGTWWHIALTFEKGAENGCKVYVNGALAAQKNAGDIANQTDATEMWIGKNQWGQNFKGLLDEMRLSADIKSADWIAADYATQSSESFLTVGDAEQLREFPDPTASLSIGSVQISNAVATVTVAKLGAEATGATVSVAVSESESFSSTVWTTSYSVSGEDTRSVAVTGLAPNTAYYARAVVSNNKGNSTTSGPVSFRTKRAPSNPSDKIIPGLEDYGALTLVDEIDCSLSLADDPDHHFREYPSGWSTVQEILGVPTRVMAHKSDTCCYVSWRVGEGKGIVPNEPYVLVVDYPDEAPRSVTVFNFGNATRHGYHTGWTAGDSWSPPYVTQSIESWAIPYSGETKQLIQVMVPFEKSKQYNGSDNRIPMDTDGFDLNFGIIKAGEAPDSVGLAVSAIRLYKIDSYDVARPSIPYPAEGLPRRIVTSREEMGDGDDFAGFAHPQDFYKGRAKMIRLLGMNTCSKDLLEFGYQQNFPGDSRWGWATDYWTEIVDNLAAEDVSILPFYEYHGSRGASGIGYMESLKPWTLNSAKNTDWKYLFSNQSYVYNCMIDMTNDEALWDLQKLFQKTIQPYLGKARFLGMWIRNRGGMPMGFNDGAIERFNQDTQRSVTRAQIYNNGSYGNTELYKAYRAWWYGKRCSVFTRLQGLINGSLPGAKVYYSNTIEEPGEFWANWGNPRPALISNEEGYTYQGKNFNEYTGKNWSTSIGAAAGQYWPNALNADCPTWGNYEVHHSAPADDPHNYTNLNNVALCYPFNTVWTVADKTASARYRNKSADLPFVRHYSLNENDFRNASNQEICGYYTCDWDHAGRAVVLSELYAMAYDDPTMLAYLFTANLVRNDSTYVREFNLNYLSLPALKGEALVGGGWPDTFTVRRWVTDKGTYWAVINCDSKPWSGTVDFRTEADQIWYTVSGQPLLLSGGKATLSLEPFQMVCFTGVEPEHVETPVFRYAFAEDVEAKAATLSVTLLDLGHQASSATVDWTISGGPADVSSGRLPTYDTHGTQTVRVTGLAPETEYTVSLLATNDKGKTATMEFTFKTALWPYVFQEPTAVTDAEGTTATASVKLTRADRNGTLKLLVGDEVKKTWDSVVAGTVYSGDFAISLGLVTRYKFVVEQDDVYETEIEGRVLGRKTIGWIDVQLDKSAYSSWPFASSGGVDPLDGGTWTKAGGAANISRYATDGGNKRIDLATEEDGYVRYSAKTDSVEGKKVRVEGRTQLAAEYGEPAALSPVPLAALALGKEGTVQTLYGYAASGWVAFPAFRVPSDGWIDWAVDFDFDAGTATYSAGDPLAALADATGATALDIANSSKTKVRTVTFVGSGAIDDFKGVYYYEEQSSLRVEAFDAELRGGAAGLSFKNAGTSTEQFEIGIKDFEPGAYYAAFAADDLGAGPDKWYCVGCADAPANATATFDLPADTSGRSALFFKVYRVTGDVMPNTPLSQLLGD